MEQLKARVREMLIEIREVIERAQAAQEEEESHHKQ